MDDYINKLRVGEGFNMLAEDEEMLIIIREEEPEELPPSAQLAMDLYSKTDCAELFRRCTELVFNNWTALELAVEHSMGGHSSYKKALILRGQIRYAIYGAHHGEADLQLIGDWLEDEMEDKFNSECADGSPHEVVFALNRYYQLILEGKNEQLETELKTLSKDRKWLGPECPLAPTDEELTIPNEPKLLIRTTIANVGTNGEIISNGIGSTGSESGGSSGEMEMDGCLNCRKPDPMDDDGWIEVSRRKK